MDELHNLLKKSKTCLFLTSAGMSADSGIPTFRDKEGYWRNFPVFKEKGLEPYELASPASFRRQPHHSWAFYEWRRRNAKENRPHSGYTVINRMINSYFENSFVHTTNTDGFHLFSGLDPLKIMEVHGSIWRIQCMRGTDCRYGFRENTDVPLCDLDYKTMSASDMPHCPHCGSLLRPHVLMFGDWEYVDNIHQQNNFQSFIYETGAPDIIFLAGSSSEIPTNDYIAKRFQSQGSKVVTINPDPASTKVCKPDIYMQTGAMNAFTLIEDMLNKLM